MVMVAIHIYNTHSVHGQLIGLFVSYQVREIPLGKKRSTYIYIIWRGVVVISLVVELETFFLLCVTYANKDFALITEADLRTIVFPNPMLPHRCSHRQVLVHLRCFKMWRIASLTLHKGANGHILV